MHDIGCHDPQGAWPVGFAPTIGSPFHTENHKRRHKQKGLAGTRCCRCNVGPSPSLRGLRHRAPSVLIEVYLLPLYRGLLVQPILVAPLGRRPEEGRPARDLPTCAPLLRSVPRAPGTWTGPPEKSRRVGMQVAGHTGRVLRSRRSQEKWVEGPRRAPAILMTSPELSADARASDYDGSCVSMAARVAMRHAQNLVRQLHAGF